jgi:hypothetical protein
MVRSGSKTSEGPDGAVAAAVVAEIEAAVGR